MQKLAGADVSATGYVKATLPLKIPTRHLNPTQYVVPEKLLQTFLSNYQAPRRANTEKTSIDGEVADGKAEPVKLSTSFEKDAGTVYTYNVEDKLVQDTLPPSAIQITKLPKNGKILTKGHDGVSRELKVGDVVSTEEMKSFRYDQGADLCSSDKKAKCKDSF